MVELSIVIPAYNESRNVTILYRKLSEVLKTLKKTYEIIYVDDGSTDGTYEELKQIKDKHVRIVRFRRNFGQTAALDAGFKNSKGNVIITLDSDLQNDPQDIPRLLEKIDKGFDIVAGWRYNRRDKFSKRFISKGAKFLRRFLLNDKLPDSGCTLRAYKKECLEDLNLYGEMHRFIHIILKMKGFKTTVIKVKHHKRAYGKTKYNMSRTFKSILDMFLLKFWMKYSARPIHLFGGLGLATSFVGFLILLYLAYVRLIQGIGIANRPALLLSILLMVIGIQFLIFGLMADILTKIYYTDKENYSIKNIEG